MTSKGWHWCGFLAASCGSRDLNEGNFLRTPDVTDWESINGVTPLTVTKNSIPRKRSEYNEKPVKTWIIKNDIRSFKAPFYYTRHCMTRESETKRGEAAGESSHSEANKRREKSFKQWKLLNPIVKIRIMLFHFFAEDFFIRNPKSFLRTNSLCSQEAASYPQRTHV